MCIHSGSVKNESFVVYQSVSTYRLVFTHNMLPLDSEKLRLHGDRTGLINITQLGFTELWILLMLAFIQTVVCTYEYKKYAAKSFNFVKCWPIQSLFNDKIFPIYGIVLATC